MRNGSAMSRDLRDSTGSTALTPPPLDLRVGPELKSQYAAGMASCLRVVFSQKDAPPDKKLLVFRNQAAEIARFITAGGVDKIEAVDSLANAADRIGIDPDTAT